MTSTSLSGLNWIEDVLRSGFETGYYFMKTLDWNIGQRRYWWDVEADPLQIPGSVAMTRSQISCWIGFEAVGS
ncbi:hypothetical protein AVEN_52360-1 [Araneus ventricosus]|uniref:Uncharacterized protein n=1 Tax=Araneus ventricosus TaxID=182803 RepID=A0A4Y2ISY6_ARAVE|nr:hypothetical protein AVEN_52360-1 [Araneus ventricosus]